VDGINISTGMDVGNVDNALRSIMAGVRNSFSATLESFLNGGSALALSSGGTGATTAADARSNLGLSSLATATTAPIANGGTGATTAAGAFTNIAISAVSLASPGYIKFINNLTVQWGSGSVGAVSFPVSMPTAAGTVVISPRAGPSDSDEADEGLYVSALSATGFTVSAYGWLWGTDR
jgi:hypothetical protein